MQAFRISSAEVPRRPAESSCWRLGSIFTGSWVQIVPRRTGVLTEVLVAFLSLSTKMLRKNLIVGLKCLIIRFSKSPVTETQSCQHTLKTKRCSWYRAAEQAHTVVQNRSKEVTNCHLHWQLLRNPNRYRYCKPIRNTFFDFLKTELIKKILIFSSPVVFFTVVSVLFFFFIFSSHLHFSFFSVCYFPLFLLLLFLCPVFFSVVIYFPSSFF